MQNTEIDRGTTDGQTAHRSKIVI